MAKVRTIFVLVSILALVAATFLSCAPKYTLTYPEMKVEGNSVEIANGDSAPSLLDYTDFGSADVLSGRVARTFTIKNTGSAALTLAGTAPHVTIGSTCASDFSVTDVPYNSIAAGDNSTFQVTFDPSAGGTRSATISIASNDCDGNPYKFDIQGTGTVNSHPNFDLQGFNLAAWSKNGWDANLPIDEALNFALDEGANFLALDWPVNFNDDGTMVPEGGTLHPSWDDIKTVIDKAKAMGFHVMLKPHVTMATSAQNRNIWNTDTASFLPSNLFPAWKTYLCDLGKFATQNNVDAICIGTELNCLDWQFRDDWVDLIGSVRLNFAGALTYDALFSLFDDSKDLNEMVFWDQLDFIGCSLYVPITTDDNATVDTLKQGWFSNSIGNIPNVIDYLQGIANRYGKQLMVLEGGYQSVNGGLYYVNGSPSPDKVVNNDLQSRGLDAYLSVLYQNKGGWLKGVSLWQITPAKMTPDGLASIYNTQEFTVYGKPAAQVVKRHYISP